MGKAFFTGWALWEKMVFVLACAIVVTIMLGCLKLVYSSWRLRRYASLPPKQVDLMREKSIIRSLSRRSAKTPMIERQRRVRELNDGVEIPFGIRAIESGIEVDGVWISRSNTPAPSARNSSANSIWGKMPNSSSNDLSQMGAQDASYKPISTIASSSRAPSRNLDRSFSAESVSNDVTSPDAIAQPPKPRYPPHSYKRYENTRHFKNSHTLENRDSSRSRPTSSYFSSDASNSRNSGSDSGSSRNGSRGSNDFQHASPSQDVLTYQPRSASSPDLDLMENNRLSHAAETGQLLPRTRRAGQSGEWASVANFTPIVSGEIVNFSMPRPESSSGPPSDSGSNPFRTPDTPTSPGFPGGSEPRSSDEGYLPTVSRSSTGFLYDRPDSTVLREVNSGFSILRPGTLDAQLQAQSQRRPPPQARSRSRSMSFDGNVEEKTRSKRLQKKRRPSMDSHRSSVSEKGPTAAEVVQEAVHEDRAKYAFGEGERPPTPADVEAGAQIEAAGGKYKF